MDKYLNYHLHTTYSNASTIDSCNSIESMIIRAKELGQTSFCITEHGNTLSKFESSMLCKKYKMKQIIGTEAYFVLDRLHSWEGKTLDKKTKTPIMVKDKSNAHIIIIAKNRNGYRQINKALSIANTTGFYMKPRIDLQIVKEVLNPNDVIITTACCGGILAKYDMEQIILEFKDFIDAGSFFIEFQAHNTDKQKEYNSAIFELAKKYNIKTTVACDTHVVTEVDEFYRDLILKRKNMIYDDEDGWMLDFPSYEELFYRFKIQGILPDEVIMESLQNTNLIDSMCENYDITEYSLKIPVPIMYRHLSSDDRFKKLKDIIYFEFEEYCKKDSYPNKNKQKYIDAIEYELGEIYGCHTHDYFLLHYEIIKRGRELGGVLTKTSRGSAACYIVNMLLHFTAIDRLQTSLPLLPQRFMTKERLLLSKSAPDIDLNMADPAPFYQATKELIGEEYCYPMIAFGKVQEKTAWKIYAATNGISVETANDVSKSIDEYMTAKKYEEEDSEIDIYDYIPSQYRKEFEDSKHFRAVIENVRQHACGHLVSPINIVEEIGLIKCKDVICAAIEGSIADKLGYVKSDFLIVSVVDIIDKIYKRIGIEQPSPQELLRNLDEKVWDIYSLGYTAEVNQFTANRTKKMMEVFLPKSLNDLSAAVSFIRPGCTSIVDKLVKREPMSFGVKGIDDILYSHTNIGSYVIYQESIMEMLKYAGIDKKETYSLLKAISKRKPEVIQTAKETFIEGIVKRIMEDKKE